MYVLADDSANQSLLKREEIRALTVDWNDGNCDQIQALCEHKAVESSEVASPDAVVDPGAMVIVSIDAMIAKCAVAASRSPDNLAIRAETASFKIVE